MKMKRSHILQIIKNSANILYAKYIKGDDLEGVIKVSTDKHTITANYDLPSNSIFNSRIKAKDISISCPILEAGKHYVIAIYEVTPEIASTEENTYMDYVLAEELEKVGESSKYKGFDKAFRICLKLSDYKALETPFIYGLDKNAAVGVALTRKEFKDYIQSSND